MADDSRSLLVVNARIATGDPRRPWVDAVWCADGRVVALGASAALRKRVPAATRVIDAAGDELRTLTDGPLVLVVGGAATFRTASLGIVQPDVGAARGEAPPPG